MLELGAGDGAFLRTLQAAGVPMSSVSAVEYSDEARKNLKRIDPSLNVFADLDQFLHASAPNSCTHVFAFQVLEHVPEPLDYLRSFGRALRPGGLVCMAVPNPGRIEANEQNGLILDMPPCHITRFTIQGVSALARQAGFELIHSEIEPLVYRAWFREFLSYHFLRRTQNDGSLQNWMETKLPWRLATIGGALLGFIPALSKSVGPKEGGSLFCVLRNSPAAPG